MWCARHVDSHVTLGDLTRVTMDLTRISNLTEDLAFSLSCPTQLSSLLQSPLRYSPFRAGQDTPNKIIKTELINPCPQSQVKRAITEELKQSKILAYITTLKKLCNHPKLNFGKVIAVGPGFHSKNGKLIPMAVKEGDTVLLPEYGGTEVKLDNKEYVFFMICFIY
ncbi:chaperonin [Glycine max]|nr:chaperonin [Glycine max]